MDQDDSYNFFEGNNAIKQEKSYTLTMICDPEESGLEKKFMDYKKFTMEQGAFANKGKRLVINGSQPNKKGGIIMSQAEDERFRRNNQQIGKIVFLKDRDIEMNAFEREISRWVPQFHFKMHQLCSKKPRFSEMRPIKFNL